MGRQAARIREVIRAGRGRLRTRTLPTLAAVLLLQISIATGRRGYDLRALSSAFGLLFLLVLALIAATLDAVATFAVETAREAARIRIRFGPVPPVAPPAPPPITDDMLLDKRGRPLRGAPRAARIAAIERERAKLVPVAAPASAARVIELPPLPDLHPYIADAYRRALPAARYARSFAATALARVDARWHPTLDRLRSLPVPPVRVPFPALTMRGLRVVAVTTTMTFVFATVIGTTGFITQRGSVALGASTTLSIISGDVSVRASGSEPFQPAVDGALLRAGMTVQTGPDTYAVLTYFEGSTVSIDPNTTLVIDALGANPDGSTVIEMTQQIGRTWHSVAKLLHQGSKYQVKTPTATATVRGTAFAVGVEADATGEIVSTVETTEGAVGTAKVATPAEPQPQEVLVQPGFQVAVTQAAPIEQPKPQPEPERRVTVTVGASAGVVLDPVGRANGIKDGKVVVQTPGATVALVGGKLVVNLSKIPDGKLATVVDRGSAREDAVEVVTIVAERGKAEQRSEERVVLANTSAAAVSAVEVKKGEAVAKSTVSEEQKREISSSVKVAEAPKAAAAEERKPDEQGRKDDKGGGGPGGPPSAPAAGFLPSVTDRPLPAPKAEPVGQVVRRAEPAKEPSKETTQEADRSRGQAPEAAREQPKQEGSSFVPRLELPRIDPAKAEPKKEEQRKAEAPKQEAPKQEAPKQEAPKQEAPKQEAPKQEPPKQDAPKQEAPRQEPPKQDAPKQEAPKQEAPKQEAPKQEAPRQEPPKQDAPKQEAPKETKAEPPASSPETSRFVPTLTLPELPFSKPEQPKKETSSDGSGKKDEPKDSGPKFELPKIELPFFQAPKEERRERERGEDRRGNDRADRSGSDRATAVGRSGR